MSASQELHGAAGDVIVIEGHDVGDSSRRGQEVVAAEHLSKRFGGVVAVDDLTFRLEAGTVTGFLGRNGAGKTTTLRMLLGLVRPTAGRALVFGRP